MYTWLLTVDRVVYREVYREVYMGGSTGQGTGRAGYSAQRLLDSFLGGGGDHAACAQTTPSAKSTSTTLPDNAFG